MYLYIFPAHTVNMLMSENKIVWLFDFCCVLIFKGVSCAAILHKAGSYSVDTQRKNKLEREPVPESVLWLKNFPFSLFLLLNTCLQQTTKLPRAKVYKRLEEVQTLTWRDISVESTGALIWDCSHYLLLLQNRKQS